MKNLLDFTVQLKTIFGDFLYRWQFLKSGLDNVVLLEKQLIWESTLARRMFLFFIGGSAHWWVTCSDLLVNEYGKEKGLIFLPVVRSQSALHLQPALLPYLSFCVMSGPWWTVSPLFVGTLTPLSRMGQLGATLLADIAVQCGLEKWR